jgi:hypothetical protein
MTQNIIRVALMTTALGLVINEAAGKDQNDCNNLFGAANIQKVETFTINTDNADFGDELHLFGAPQGTAVVCWLNNGRVSVIGKLYSDAREPHISRIEVVFRRTNGQFTDIRRSSVATQGLPVGPVPQHDIQINSPNGNFDRVGIRLISVFPDTGLRPRGRVVAERLFRRRGN